jgi:hypothetical protein
LLLAPIAAVAQFDHQHTAWSALLKKYVDVVDGGKASRVHYAALARDGQALDAYLAALSAVSTREFGTWSKPQQLAFLINAYNAHMIELILVSSRYERFHDNW